MSTMKFRVPIAALALLSLASLVNAAVPAGWFIAGDAPKDYEFGVDAAAVHDGSRSAYIKAKSANSSGFGTLMQNVAARNYLGSRVRLSAFLRADHVHRGQMWMRIDSRDRKAVSFDNMDSRPIIGSSDWQRYEVVLDVPGDAELIAFGFFLAGSGTLWADEFTLEIVEKTVPLTVAARTGETLRAEPVNAGFEE